MKSLKHIAVSALLAISVLCVVWYSSCSKDACKGVTCMNYGMCSGGSCICDSGTGGNNCEVIYRNLYSNTYSGVAVFSFNTADTIDRAHADTSNTLVFSHTADTLFNNMQVIWQDSSSQVTLPIVLSNNTAAGSDFKVNGPVTIGNYTYTGSGSVSITAASLTLLQYPLGGGPAVTITLNNFVN